MRIFVVINTGVLGGAEQFLKMLVRHFYSVGYHVDVFFLKDTQKHNWADLEGKVNMIINNSSSELKGIIPLLKYIRKSSGIYDYVFSSHIHIIGFLGILRRLGVLKTQFFIGRESTIRFKRVKGVKISFYKLLYKLGYPSLDLLICQTQLMREELLRNMPHLRAYTHVIPNPISIEEIELRQTMTFDSVLPDKFIVSAGRLIHEKGFDVLIEAFAIFKQKLGGFKLVILGDGHLKDSLYQLVIDKEMQDEVIFLGHVNNVIPYFKRATACVVSSRIEGFPNVLLQMMSQNTKVVSTYCAGGIKEINGIEGCATGDGLALANSLIKVVLSETIHNRSYFDEELKKRSIENFFRNVKEKLHD